MKTNTDQLSAHQLDVRKRFIGNRHTSYLDSVCPGRKKTMRELYEVGRPVDCPLGNAKEMAERGYVGLYLKGGAS